MSDTTFLPFTIADGYERTAYIAPLPNLHGEVRFTYRPLTHAFREAFSEKYAPGPFNQKPIKESEDALIAMLCSKIRKWSLVDKDGSPLKIDAPTMTIVIPRLLDRFQAIITGREGGDIDPLITPSKETINSDTDATFKAMLEETSVADQKEAADQKN